ncbi:MAG: iron-containing alcohol dehydrogenase [Candidatus Omnitrophota bacterium]
MFHKFFSDNELGFWRFYCNTKIFFGRGEVFKILREIVNSFGGKIGVLTDENVNRLHFTENFLAAVQDQISSVHFAGREANYSDIEKVVTAFRKSDVKTIMAIGGGSVLDSAKVASVLVNNPMDITALHNVSELENPRVPLIAIPTTFGTGSEVNMYAVVNNESNTLRTSIKNFFLTPDIAIINPDVAKETPVSLKYEVGIDAFVHALEVLTLKREISPVQIPLMRSAMDLFFRHFKNYVENPHDEDEEAIATASIIAGIGVNNSRSGLIHSLANKFAKHQWCSHPVSLIPFILPCLRLNWSYDRKYFQDMPWQDFYRQMKERILFRPAEELSCLAISKDMIDVMAEECLTDTVILKENPVILSKQVFKLLYEQALCLGGNINSCHES